MQTPPTQTLQSKKPGDITKYIHGNFRLTKKPWNGFYHPMNGQLSLWKRKYDSRFELQYQIQIGSKLFPEYPITSVAETFCQLRKTTGIFNSTQLSCDIDQQKYRTLHHIVATDAEKTLQAGYTGLNTRMGDLLTVKIKPMDASICTEDNMPDSIQIILHSDQIMNIGDTGIQVMD